MGGRVARRREGEGRERAAVNPERSISKTFLTLLIQRDQKKGTATCHREVAM